MQYIDLENATYYVPKTEFLEQLERIFLYVLEDLKIPIKSVELLFVDNAKIKAMNFEFRQINRETDVLSFPLALEFSPFLGSVVISLEYAERKSIELNHSLEEEILLLFIHGVLHLVGFDHEVDNGEQREKEIQIIQYFNLPKSLIVRTQG